MDPACKKLIFIAILCAGVMYLLFLNRNNFAHTEVQHTLNHAKDTLIYKFITRGLRKESGVYIKGMPLVTKTWILTQLKPFLSVYGKRPSLNNEFGSQITHQFAMWCVIKHLKPKHIIESGIYQGLGTWMLRQAAPDAQIILLDPNGLSGSVYKDNHTDTIYMIGKKFVDFGSVEWSKILSPQNTLVYIDDHQYPFKRLKQAKKFGFEHIMFDDNYWLPADVLSLKQMVAFYKGEINLAPKYPILENGKKIADYKAVLNQSKELFEIYIDTYWEFPKLWHCDLKRYECNTNANNNNVLVNVTDGVRLLTSLGLDKTKIPPPGQINGYYNVVYVKLK